MNRQYTLAATQPTASAGASLGAVLQGQPHWMVALLGVLGVVVGATYWVATRRAAAGAAAFGDRIADRVAARLREEEEMTR